jgi:hypothetical protein
VSALSDVRHDHRVAPDTCRSHVERRRNPAEGAR